MPNPKIAAKEPVKVNLKKGTVYYFCSCRRSTNRPLCDGLHAATSFVPKAFAAKEDGDAYLCACKHSISAPYCDGTHGQFNDNQVGNEGPHLDTSASDSPKVTATEVKPTVEFIHQLAEKGPQ